MEDMENRILEILRNARKGTVNTKQLEKELNIQSSADFVAFSRTLDQMSSDYDLVRTRNGCWMSAEQAGVIKGKISVNRKGAGFIDRENRPSVTIAAEEMGEAMDKDTVAVRYDDRTLAGTVLKVLVHANEHLIGTYQYSGRKMECVLDDIKLADAAFRVETAKDFTPSEGLKVLLHIEKYGKPMVLSIEKVIGYKDDPGVDILSVLLDHDIVAEFPEEVTEQVRAIPQTVQEQEKQNRVNLCRVPTITIDGDDSKDFDDAVSVSKNETGWNLKVSIADVAHYVREDSPLDQEAYRRGTSTYVTDRVVPMLPRELSNGICSLNPGEVRLTNTCEMNISREGTVLDYRIYSSYICSFERMTYHNVNLILDQDPEMCEKYSELGSLFTDLRDCADAIRGQRRKKGAIDFESDEAEIRVDENGTPLSIQKKEHGHAEEMIEDCMIAANVSVASFMNSNGFPCVYRIHEAPAKERMKDFSRISDLLGSKFICPANDIHPLQIQQYLESCKESPDYPVISSLMLRCMKKAVYDEECRGHFGLAESEYLHFTSPIRRYPDLIVHRMLERYSYSHCTDPAQISQDQKRMIEDAEQSSLREKASTDAEWEAEDMKKAEYMASHLGETVTGIISSVTGFGFYVKLENTIEGLVRLSSLNDDYYNFDEDRLQLTGERTGKIYRIGQEIQVCVLAASKDSRSIDFGTLDQRKPKAEHSAYRRADTRGRRSDSDRRTGYQKQSYGNRDSRSDGKPSYQKKSYGTRDSRSDGKPSYQKKSYGNRDSRSDGKPSYQKKSYGTRDSRSDGKPSYQKKSYGTRDSHNDRSSSSRGSWSDQKKSSGRRGSFDSSRRYSPGNGKSGNRYSDNRRGKR